MKYFNDVFISYKHTDENNCITEDFYIAEQLHKSLTDNGISTFFSNKTLFSLGASDYKKAIDAALNSARVLVVIGTSEANITSPWVEYEYETFYSDYLSKKKAQAVIISYTKNISTNDLPRTLSRFQNFSMPFTQNDKICEFIINSLNQFNQTSPVTAPSAVQQKPAEPLSADIKAEPKNHKSIYTSDYRNELSRLEVQSRNSFNSDKKAIDYVLTNAEWDKDEKICVLDIGCAYGYVANSRFGSLENVDKILCIDNNEKVLNRAKIIFAENKKMIFEHLDVEDEFFTDALEKLREKHSIERFHIVFSALTIHHLKNPDRLLRKLRKIMAKDSYIIIRGSDDGSKLCYPHFELMKAIIDKTMSAKGVSDRENGRKIYTQLFDSGYKDIVMLSEVRDLSKLEYDDRLLLFQESFSYRINYFKKALDITPYDRDAAENHQWMEDALEEFENHFFKKDFWYCEYDYIGIAKK